MGYLVAVAGFVSAVCLCLCLFPVPVRMLAKKAKGPAKQGLKKLSKPIRKHHKTFGYAALGTALAHVVACSIVLHHGSSLGVASLLLCLLLCVNGTRKATKRWLHVHRTLAGCLCVAVVLHIGTSLLS